MWVDADREDILTDLDSVEVSDEHICLLTWMIRRELYASRVGMTDDVEHFFDLEIRGNLIKLLVRGSWVDEPENLGLKKLNYRLEKIDLGRRNDLNFSRWQSDVHKYDQDLIQKNMKKNAQLPDWEKMYLNGDKAFREELLNQRPWMRSMMEEKYGSEV